MEILSDLRARCQGRVDLLLENLWCPNTLSFFGGGGNRRVHILFFFQSFNINIKNKKNHNYDCYTFRSLSYGLPGPR